MNAKEALENIKNEVIVEDATSFYRYKLVTDEEDIEHVGENMIYYYRKSFGDFLTFDEFLSNKNIKFKIVKWKALIKKRLRLLRG